MRMRQIPDLEFRDDRSMEHAEQIGRTLRELQLAAPSPAESREEPEGRE
jgi:ribosome-binding factor A